MNISLLYGSSVLSLKAASEAVERALNLRMELHDSLYRGGDYFLLKSEGLKLILQENFLDTDGEIAESNFPKHGVIMYVDGTSDEVKKFSNTAQESLQEFDLLHEED